MSDEEQDEGQTAQQGEGAQPVVVPPKKPKGRRKSALFQAMREQDEALQEGEEPQSSDTSVQEGDAVKNGVTPLGSTAPQGSEKVQEGNKGVQESTAPQDRGEVQQGNTPQSSTTVLDRQKVQGSTAPQGSEKVEDSKVPQSSIEVIDSTEKEESTAPQNGKNVVVREEVRQGVAQQEGKEVLQGEVGEVDEEALEKVTFYITLSQLEKLEDMVHTYKKRTKVRRANRSDIIRSLIDQVTIEDLFK